MATRKTDDSAAAEKASPKTSGAKTVRSTLTYPYEVDITRFAGDGRPAEKRRTLVLLPQHTHQIVPGTPAGALELRESDWARARDYPQVKALMDSAKIIEAG